MKYGESKSNDSSTSLNDSPSGISKISGEIFSRGTMSKFATSMNLIMTACVTALIYTSISGSMHIICWASMTDHNWLRDAFLKKFSVIYKRSTYSIKLRMTLPTTIP